MAQLSELTGIFIREFQRWDSVAMCRVEPTNGAGEVGSMMDKLDEVVVKIECDQDELKTDLEYRFVGTWRNHPRYGRQFHASSFTLVQPHTRQGIITYLVRAGEGLRFGPSRAAALYDHWGQETVAKCRTEPGEVCRVLADRKLRFDHSAAVNLQARLGDDAAMEATTLELLDLLTGRGFPRGTVREAIREWGANAAAVVRRDPYKLMRFRGCGYKRTDAMYMELGLPPGRLKRQALAAWYAIARDSEGHTWYPIGVAVKGIVANVGGADLTPEPALRLARLGRVLSEIRTCRKAIVRGAGLDPGEYDQRWLAERLKADHEKEIAEIVAEAEREGVTWPK